MPLVQRRRVGARFVGQLRVLEGGARIGLRLEAEQAGHLVQFWQERSVPAPAALGLVLGHRFCASLRLVRTVALLIRKWLGGQMLWQESPILVLMDIQNTLSVQ